MLTSINEEYSTFSANFDDFIRIYNRQSYGCFKVPRISECLLLDLHDSDVVKIISSKSINNLIDFSNEALEKSKYFKSFSLYNSKFFVKIFYYTYVIENILVIL